MEINPHLTVQELRVGPLLVGHGHDLTTRGTWYETITKEHIITREV